ncbi:glycosyltransferase family 2 protein [Roseovarius aestuarii]|uniref:Putative glycosyltransferase EpsE n=1 Tax=Roseovarius aestuarii TaxID=475083 RepID=A0A1X7BTA3_9RHOB|nr:glycosyltransferase family 2 protein [Roseovarius aestuarii]SMC12857.1 Putative glycosyltransferase EpsE [Roseovarius aestuarii]
MLDRSPPLVSVIMANFNGQEHLARAVHSVLAQTVTDVELLLADDASTDASLPIAERIMRQDDRLRILRGPRNSGPAAARNRALTHACGEWIAVVDSDDIIHPERLERLIVAAETERTDGIADDLIFFGKSPQQHGQVLSQTLLLDTPVDLTPGALLDMPTLGYLKPVLRRSVVGELRYRKDMRIGEDHDFYMRYLLRGGRLRLIGQSYYLYRRHGNSISHRQHPEDVTAMLNAQDDLVAQFPDIPLDLASRFSARRNELDRSLQFERLVRDIKQQKWRAVLHMICKIPALLAPLLRAMREHWQNRIGQKQAPQDTAPSDVVLQTDEQIRDRPPQGAMPLTIPKHPGQWEAADWAKFMAALPARVDRVFAKGAPGRFALGYVPQCNAAILEAEDSLWTDSFEFGPADLQSRNQPGVAPLYTAPTRGDPVPGKETG